VPRHAGDVRGRTLTCVDAISVTVHTSDGRVFTGPVHRTSFPNCTTCHHAEPVDAGLNACSQCHSLDPADLNSYKEIAHDQNESGDGCRACHEHNGTADGTWDCSFCHSSAE